MAGTDLCRKSPPKVACGVAIADSSPARDQQFDYLSWLRHRFQRRGLPILSADTKKRELTGNFKNPGAKWDRSPVLVNDHDFRCDSTGVAIPYGIYDLLANRGAVFVGVSHDTPCFAAHSIAQWWRREGADRYAGARQLLILGDTGTSKWNSVEHGLFSEISKNRAGEPLASHEQRQMAHHNSP